VTLTDAAVTTKRVELPDCSEQQPLWAAVLGPLASGESAGHIEGLASAFRVGVPMAESVAVDVAVAESTERAQVLWEATRGRLRTGLDALADRIAPAAGWDDLVLPADAVNLLTELVRHARHRELVAQTWAEQRGHGVTAMFTGDSGTGKTMAAEVVAAELGLDLYRIDLARVVDKYIGETEKNLSRVFDAAEASGAVLLFDEADALFGKRGEVKDAHDRYANLEVAHLLTRMETYRGVAVLTTNMTSTIDRAFLRRLRFIVQFPFPDESARRRLWQRAFPPSVPVADLDFDRLARLPIAGGTIRAIAVAAAIQAAHTQAPVSTDGVLAAARREFIKAGKNPGLAALGSPR
jgi:vesicle-fusing ATPase